MTIHKTKGYDLFVGIDWSGAVGEYHHGIQVACLTADASHPTLVKPPVGRAWSRQSVIDYLTKEAKYQNVLAGIDFAFAHPFLDQGGYYPGYGESPPDPSALWQMVNQIGQNHNDGAHYYGGVIFRHDDLGQYYNHHKSPPKNSDGSRRDLFVSRRRQTEIAAIEMHKRSPSPTFNCIGAAGVGTGSLAGMRILHHLSSIAHIWPFHSTGDMDPSAAYATENHLTLVEIFPALYFTMAGVSDKDKKSDPLGALKQGLAYFDTSSTAKIAFGLPDLDDLDAMISAAALRHLHDPVEVFCIQNPDHKKAAAKEGWIFGVGGARKAS